MSPIFRQLSRLTLLFLLVPTLPLFATTGQRIGPPEIAEPQAYSGRLLVEVQDDHKLVVAVDAYEGMALADGWLDRLVVFVSEDALEPLRYDGFGLVRVEERHATLLLPGYDQVFVLSLAGDAPTELPIPERGTVRRLSRGLVLATHSPGTRQTLTEGLTEERTRQRIRPALDGIFQQDPGNGDPSGETCRSSCSANCTDGSSCSTSCNTSQCAECDCPASCYCRVRTGV